MELKIAICDDEKYYREHIKEIVAGYLKEQNVSSEIDLYSSGTEFCGNEINLMQYDIIFLDIEMDMLNGMDVAHAIRKRNSKAEIVFITVMTDYVFEGYEVNASRYIMKEDLDRLLPGCIDALLGKWMFQRKKIRLHFTDGYEEIFLNELMYIESNLHKLCFVTTNRKLYQYNKLDDLELRWSQLGFIRCHQSFLVNPEHIVKIKSYIIYLTDGTEIPVAKGRYGFVKKFFLAYKEVE